MGASTRSLRTVIALVLCLAGVTMRFQMERGTLEAWLQPIQEETSVDPSSGTNDDGVLADNNSDSVGRDQNSTGPNGDTAVVPNNTATMTAESPAPVGSKRLKAPLFHIGKAGGTSTMKYLINTWRIHVKECHPTPCRRAAMSGRGGGRFALMNIRDPVDRFVSAFYFSIQRTCKPRQRHNCVKKKPEEIYITHTRYGKNASWLAEDLCSPSNATAARIAHESLRGITHLRHGIVEWLNYTYRSQKLFPIVLEPGATELPDQIDTAVEWLYRTVRFETPAAFARRRRRVNATTGRDARHHMSSARTKRDITPEAEACLERYYRRDYEMLQVMEREMCKTEHCHEAIQSILKRRYRAFEGGGDVTVTVPTA